MKQEARRNQTKNKIFDAAVAEFSTKGLDGARIDRIADTAQVNKQRIYEYFGNKQDLYATILKKNYMLVVKEEEKFVNLTEKDIPELAEHILKLYFDFHKKHPEFWRILAWENLNGGKHSQQLDKFKTKAFKNLKILYSKGQECGICNADVSFESFIFILTSISFFYFSNQATMSKTLNNDLSNKKIEEKIINEALALIYHKQ